MCCKLRREQETFEEREASLAAHRLCTQRQSEEQQEARLVQLRSNQAERLAAVILTKTRHISYTTYHYLKCFTLFALDAGTHIPQSIKMYISQHDTTHSYTLMYT